MNFSKLALVVLFSSLFFGVYANTREGLARTVYHLKKWEFTRDSLNSKQVHWKMVNIPHDWAIEGPFDRKWDLQVVAIKENNERKATEKSGRSGALPWIGEGHYKTRVKVLGLAKTKAFLCFDGAMAEATVYVNGIKAGYWPYGYNAFRLDVTELLKEGENEIAVNLYNMENSSRWYPGAGLYRPVKLVIMGASHLDPWATSIRTKSIDNETAVIDYETKVCNPQPGMTCTVNILDKQGNIVAHCSANANANAIFHESMIVKNPLLWSPESPYLYKVHTKLIKESASSSTVIDEITTNFGIRTISVDSTGFKLNGKVRKIKGVCLHHDLGPLGAAVNKAALIRQVRLMKDMGCDAIRTAHNMPSEMQVEVCDSMGMMLMAESFDMWIRKKCKNGYCRFFVEWAEKDLTNEILHFRNNPSIVMWSIGNEIPEQIDSVRGPLWVNKLQGLCHRLDPTRPVTQGINHRENAVKSGVAQIMDVIGLNYCTSKYSTIYNMTPQKFILGAETTSALSSRGVYKLPYKINNKHWYDDGQCSSYDTECASWSNLPEKDFENMDDLPWTIGQFVWTGIDYLGEPTPYDEYWPSRSSYFGICDLAGLPKDRYYLYRSLWQKDSHTLHILPHWTWGKGMIGKNIPVQVYSDYDEAELFVNGKSQGRIKKHSERNSMAGTSEGWDSYNLDRYRLRWMNTIYEPGELKVVAYDNDGNTVMTKTIHTAGEPAKLSLSADRSTIAADGNDLSYITVSMTDKDGNLCPNADDEIEVIVTGDGYFKAICNGDATSLESFTEPHMKLFHGMLVITVQSSEKQGKMKVMVRSKNQKIQNSITIRVKS